MIANLVAGFVVIIIGVTLAPTIANEVQGARYNGSGTVNPNITGASNTVLGLVTLFYCLAVASSGMALTTMGLRNSGLM